MATIIKTHNRKILNECETTDSGKDMQLLQEQGPLPIWWKNDSQITLSRKLQSRQHPAPQVLTLTWQKTTSKQVSTTINSLLGTKTTHTTRYSQNTSGTYGTTTRNMTSSDTSSRGQTPKRETPHAAIYAWTSNLASWLPAVLLS